MNRVLGGAGLAALCLAVPPAQAQRLDYEGGLSLSTGSYIFTERTTNWTLFNGLALSAGRLSVRVTVPLVMQNTRLLTSSGLGQIPTGGGPASGAVRDSSRAGGDGMGGGMGSVSAVSNADSRRRVEPPPAAVTGFEAHVGDPVVSADLGVVQSRRGWIRVGGAMKIPLTDTTTFGTGAWDVGGTVSLAYLVRASTALGIDASVWRLGDLPELDLRNPVLVTVGITHLTASGWGGSANLQASRSVVSGFQDAVSIGVGLSRLLSRGTVGVSGSIGLTEMAPDLSLGFYWSIGVFRRN